MGLFSRRAPSSEASGDDEAWLSAGYKRWDRDSEAHNGSPKMLAKAGAKALRKGDIAKATFFYADAIDRMNTWSAPSSSMGWVPSPADLAIIDQYIDLVEQIRATHPQAAITGRRYNFDGTYTAQMIRGIAMRVNDPGPFNVRLARLVEAAGVEPWW
jgi:hypothetical protein